MSMSDPDPLLDATNDPPSTDTDAVQNLIIALRASLTSTQTLLNTQATRLTHLGDIEAELAKLKDEHTFVSAAKEAVDAKLKEEIKRREVAEETVEAMRGQVEAARRGVMTLQKQDKERKRMSTLGGGGLGGLGFGGVGEEEEVLRDLAAAVNAGPATTTKDKSSKRQSILKSHRRISSQSEPDAIYASPTTMISPAQIATPVMPVIPSQPGRPGLREFKLGTTASITGTSMNTTTSTSPRPSSSQQDDYITSPKAETSIMPTSTSNAPSNPDESIRLRSEINALQLQLAEAEEAREASENCLKALREFIASSPGGGGTDTGDQQQLDLASADLVGIRLPPLPTDKDPDEPPTPPAKEEKKLGAAGWGIGKLWKGQSNSGAQSIVSPRSTAVEPSTPGLLSPGASIRSLPQRSSSPTSTISQLPGQQEPTEEKVNAVASTSTPLSNFVASWTKTVAPGTPAAITPAQGQGQGSASLETRPPAARGFSGLWGRKKEDVKGKDLPDTPETGTFDMTPDQQRQFDGNDKDDQNDQSELEPSPFIMDEQAGSTSIFDAHDHKDQPDDENKIGEPEVQAEGELEPGMTTPKQSDRDSKELVPVELDGPDTERTASNEHEHEQEDKDKKETI